MRRSVFILILAALLLVAGCSDSSDDEKAAGGLDGTWVGHCYWADSGTLQTVSVTISGGTITDVQMGGSSLGVSGPISHEGGGVYGYELNDGTVGGFLVDASGLHAGFIDEWGTIGAVQKGGGGATYAGDDIAHTWSGWGLTTDFYDHATFTASVTVSAAVEGTWSFSGSASDAGGSYPFSGAFSSFSAGHGIWEGLDGYTGTAGWYETSGTGNIDVYMSADKTFIAGEACIPDYSAFPTGCSFFILNR